MIKTLAAANKAEKVPFRVPNTVQQSIPIERVYSDGTWLVGRKHSRTWRFTDINYASASDADQKRIFKGYCAVINSLPTDASCKITIVNHRLNPVDFERTMLMKDRSDGLDQYRHEKNRLLMDRASLSNNLVQDKYITISIPQRKKKDSDDYFSRVDSNLTGSFGKLSSTATMLRNADRLRLFHDFFRAGEEPYYRFDHNALLQSGASYKDLIAPDGLAFKKDYFEMGGKYGRVLYLREYASYISDQLISNLTNFPRSLVLSIDMLPIPTDEAVKEIQRKILGVESDITRWQQRQNGKNNFSANIPYELEQSRADTREYLDDLTNRDQRMIFAVVTLVHLADTKEQLDADTESLVSIGGESVCTFGTLRYEQEQGLNTVLPYGLRQVHALRTLTTESTATLMPFRVQEIQDRGGFCYGVNAISRNLLICDRKRLIAPHAFYLGVSGSGKSMTMKNTIADVVLGTEDDVIIIDAEREYGSLARAFGGEVIQISPYSQHHINPLEVSTALDKDENPVAMKSELLNSIIEQQMGVGIFTGAHKSIIDRCVQSVFRPWQKSKGKKPVPLLTDWRNEVLKQPEPEAREIALAAEIITEGSLNVFSHPSNVDVNSRIIVLDLYEMGDQLRPTALVVTLDAIQNRVIENRKRGKFTWVFIDEVYLYFKYHYSAEILYKAWKRFRKYGAALTAATQNVEECLRSETARLMFANSEFLILLNQAATDREELGRLLHISETQMGFVTDVEAGHGLLRMGGAIVPFANTMPKDTELYRLMTTTPGEG